MRATRVLVCGGRSCPLCKGTGQIPTYWETGPIYKRCSKCADFDWFFVATKAEIQLLLERNAS